MHDHNFSTNYPKSSSLNHKENLLNWQKTFQIIILLKVTAKSTIKHSLTGPLAHILASEKMQMIKEHDIDFNQQKNRKFFVFTYKSQLTNIISHLNTHQHHYTFILKTKKKKKRSRNAVSLLWLAPNIRYPSRNILTFFIHFSYRPVLAFTKPSIKTYPKSHFKAFKF